MAESVKSAVESIVQEMVALRRELHAHPQLAYQETYASRRVQEQLAAAGVEFAAPVATTGVVGWILPSDPAAAARPAVALRADMDALAMTEETGLPYASGHPGCMHACGHDGHTAMLVGAARVLAQRREALPQPVKLLFQPAEEDGGGARGLIDAGCMDERLGGCAVGSAFALHGFPGLKLGEVAVRTGPAHAGVETFDIHIEGRGGHAASPHQTRDPILTACHVVTALQSVVSRSVNPVEPSVLSICTFQAGAAHNVIPPRVLLKGTIRSFCDDVAALAVERMKQIVAATSEAMGCTGRVQMVEHYPPVINDAGAAETARRAAAAMEAVTLGHTPLSMGGEDFAYFGQMVPACLIRLGLTPPDQESSPVLHDPRFDFNDAALPIGIELLCRLAMGG